MSHRDQIFQGIRQAITALPERAAYPDYDTAAVTTPRWLPAAEENETLFRKRLTGTGGFFFESPADCAAWLKKDGAKSVYLAPEVAHLAADFAAHLEVVPAYTRDAVDRIDAAVTVAHGAIAESGTVILTDSGTPDRLAALAPWWHIAVVPRTGLVRTIGEAIAALPADPGIVWVTGPSKTADVEGILIQGVHGPGRQGSFFL
ncbi:MAG: hypothetical protein BGO12_06060 [Verrucomicrobia bacterium 61-8]|nr:LUD domain-containing protein [Verrucomicrobiota bacterium]OJU99526.1 MAG: hypothetical protein BGO12_06060 [Verrucomicrobia bacterium 61-8]